MSQTGSHASGTRIIDDDARNQEDIDDAHLEHRWSVVEERVKDYVQVTFHELHAASRSQTQELLNGLRFARSTKDKTARLKELEGWEEFTSGEMQNMKESARVIYEKLIGSLMDQLGDRIISERVIKELDDKFRDENVDFKPKEIYIKERLPLYIKNWRAVADRRKELLKDPRFKELTSSDVSQLAAFKDERQFLELSYPERKGLTDTIESLLDARDRGMEKLHAQLEKKLTGYVHDGYLHPSKVGTWLARIFRSNATSGHIEMFVQEVLEPFADNWKAARERFDDVDRELQDHHANLRGFRTLNANQFLLLDYEQRIAYLDEAESRLKSDVNDPDPLNRLTLDIRHCFDVADWEKAEELLKTAKGIDASDKRLLSMERYLLTHRTLPATDPLENGKKATELNEQLRHMILQLPGDMQWLTEQALADRNPNMIVRLWQVFYNRVWVIEHGYSTPDRDRKEGESDWNQKQTARRIADGHDLQLEHNIIDGETAHDAGINDNPSKPQVIHMGKTGRGEVREAVQCNADNSLFGYWTTVVLNDVPYEAHRRAVKNYMYLIKRNARELRALGFGYAKVGAPVSLN